MNLNSTVATVQSGGVTGLLGDLAGFYRDIEVAKASNNGAAGYGMRPESIPDQSSVGVNPLYNQGMYQQVNPSTVNVMGLQMNKSILWVTGLTIGGLAVIRALKK